MNRSENLDALGAALAKAQGEVEGARKDSKNPHFKSNYADLASVWAACREALTSNGLCVVQMPGPCADGRMELTTTLLHSSGQFLSSTLSIPLAKADAQAYGSAVTYARRYALAAVVGVSPEDDDGNAASRPGPPAAANNGNGGPIAPQQLDELRNLAGEVGADLARFCGYLKIGSLPELPAARFADAKAALEAKRKAAA